MSIRVRSQEESPELTVRHVCEIYGINFCSFATLRTGVFHQQHDGGRACTQRAASASRRCQSKRIHCFGILSLVRTFSATKTPDSRRACSMQELRACVSFKVSKSHNSDGLLCSYVIMASMSPPDSPTLDERTTQKAQAKVTKPVKVGEGGGDLMLSRGADRISWHFLVLQDDECDQNAGIVMAPLVTKK